MSPRGGLTLALALGAVGAATGCKDTPPSASVTRPSGGKVELIAAPITGAVADIVAAEVARGVADRVPVIVYVGAAWCEPCRAFHDAAVAGALDAELGPVRFITFDLDRDGPQLEAAGYRSTLVPLFAKPRPDGRASGVQTDGAKTGSAYVPQLVPRIRALL